MQRGTALRRMASTSHSPASSNTPPWQQWRLNPPSAASENAKTYKGQRRLPRLPVPKLSDTIPKLRAGVPAVARGQEETQAFLRKLNDFENSDLARKLQERLQARADDPNTVNWLAEDWDQGAYMTYRDSVVMNVSYFYGFSRLPQRPDGAETRLTDKADPAYVAATIAAYALNYRLRLSRGDIEPDLVLNDPLCMEAYRWLFNACRIPGQTADYGVKIREDDPAGDHFIVIRRDRFYKVATRDKQGCAVSFENLLQAIRKIASDSFDAPPSVGVLTSADRDTWLAARTHLIDSSSSNAAHLSEIERAAFAIALDEASPSSHHDSDEGIAEFSRQLLHGAGRNRFWDKPVQWVVFASGEAGIIGEHSCMDGTPTAMMNDHLSRWLISGKPVPGSEQESGRVAITPLDFEVDDQTRQTIRKAEDQIDSRIANHTTTHLRYRRYGKEGIKRQKASPDGWVQMAFQLAYAMQFGRSCATYESAQTRRFALGRTEVVRVCSAESRAWVEAMLRADASDDERRQLFRTAISQQGKDMKAASAGMGVDRHIFGLKHCLQDGEEPPALFSDELFVRSSHWNLSTSQVYGLHFNGYGWSAVVPDGFGVPYLIQPQWLQFTVTSLKSMPNESFTANIGKALDWMIELFEADPALAPKAKL